MNANETKSAFEQVLKVLSPDMNQLLPEDGISGMLKFYQNERIEGCDLENDGDMILFQWGVFDLTGRKEFQINITRQVILNDNEPYQLLLTFYYEVNNENSTIKAGNYWCRNIDEISVFISFIESSPAYKDMKGKKATRVELIYQQC